MTDPNRDREAPDIESRIAALPLAPPAINRDTLMYRAGWAAAEAAMNRRRGPRLWRAAACLSAAAAVVLAFQLRDSSERVAVERPLAEALAPKEASPIGLAEPITRPPPARPPLAVRRGGLDESWVAHERGVAVGTLSVRGFVAADPFKVAIGAGAAPGDPSPPRPATARSLIRELLPADRSTDPGADDPVGATRIHQASRGTNV